MAPMMFRVATDDALYPKTHNLSIDDEALR